MKTNFLKSALFTQPLTRSLAAGVIAAGLAFAGPAFAQDSETEGETKQVAQGQEILVTIDDLKARAEPDSEFVREDLLRDAFYRAAKRNKAIGEYKFAYNRNVEKDARGYLEFDIIDWDRSASGMYECTVRASYRDLDGEKINLGVFHGMRSGIDVSTGWDVSDHFVESAQEAFSQALKKLEKEALAS